MIIEGFTSEIRGSFFNMANLSSINNGIASEVRVEKKMHWKADIPHTVWILLAVSLPSSQMSSQIW